MNIVLIRSPKHMIEGIPDMHVTPPLGMALIAASLKGEGHNVHVIDAFGETLQQHQYENIPINSTRVPAGYKLITNGLSFDEIAKRIPPDIEVIGFSCMFTINWLCDRALINYLSARFPNALIIAGGESITGMAEDCLAQTKALSVCVLGEGEETCIDLLDALANKNPLDTVKGIVFRTIDGNIIKTLARERIRNIDNIPYPAWELFPLNNYHRQSVLPGEEPRLRIPLLATRGCPYKCTFCTSPDMWGTRYFIRKPESVVKEIEHIKQNFGATSIELYDLTAIINKKWIVEFAKLLVEKDLGIVWRMPAGTRSEAIDEEVAYWLKKSGCYKMTYAPESGSSRMLELISKKVSIDKMLESIGSAKKNDLFVDVNLILALPDEKHTDVWKTLWFLFKCRRSGVNDMNLFFFRPYPGSVLFHRLIRENKLQVNDDYVVESIFIVDIVTENIFYNDNVSPFCYKVYQVLAQIIFYGFAFLKNPTLKLYAQGRPYSRKSKQTPVYSKEMFPKIDSQLIVESHSS